MFTPLILLPWQPVSVQKKGNKWSIYLSIGINVRFAAMMADVGDGLL